MSFIADAIKRAERWMESWQRDFAPPPPAKRCPKAKEGDVVRITNPWRNASYDGALPGTEWKVHTSRRDSPFVWADPLGENPWKYSVILHPTEYEIINQESNDAIAHR